MSYLSIAILIAGLSLSVSGCGKGQETVQSEKMISPLRITLSQVRNEEVERNTEATGIVISDMDASVAARVTGIIGRLHYKDGERVSSGAIVIEIDDRDIRAQLEQARALEAESEALLRISRIQLDRLRMLLEDKSVSDQEFDNAKSQHEMATAKLQQARSHIGSLEIMLDHTKVRAPFSGIMTEKNVEVGEMASPGRPLFRIIADHPTVFEADVREADISAVKKGQDVGIRIDALNKTFNGRVSRIIPSGDRASHSFRVKVEIPGKHKNILPGMFGRMHLQKGMSSILFADKRSIANRGGLTGVFVVKEARARFVPIRMGTQVGDKVEVLSGLNEGDETVINVPGTMMDGTPVEVQG